MQIVVASSLEAVCYVSSSTTPDLGGLLCAVQPCTHGPRFGWLIVRQSKRWDGVVYVLCGDLPRIEVVQTLEQDLLPARH